MCVHTFLSSSSTHILSRLVSHIPFSRGRTRTSEPFAYIDGWADSDIKSQSVLGPADSLRPRFVLPARRSPSVFSPLSLRRSVSTLSFFSHHPLASTCYVLRSLFIFVFFNLILFFGFVNYMYVYVALGIKPYSSVEQVKEAYEKFSSKW